MSEINLTLDVVFKKCDNDYSKFLAVVATYLQTKVEFSDADFQNILLNTFKNNEKKLRQSASWPLVTKLAEKNELEHKRMSLECVNKSIDDFIPATQFLEQKPMNINEESCDIFDVDETSNFEAAGGNNDALLDKVKNTSAPNNIQTDDDDDDEIIPETQYAPSDHSDVTENEISEKIVEPRVSKVFHFAGKSQDTCNKADIEKGFDIDCGQNTEKIDNTDDFIEVKQESNTLNSIVIEQESQNVMAQLNRSLLLETSLTKMNESNNSDRLGLCSTVENDKIEFELEISALKLGEIANQSGHLANAKPSVAENQHMTDDRSTSVTPDLDQFYTPIADNAITNGLELMSPVFISANSKTPPSLSRIDNTEAVNMQPANEIEKNSVFDDANADNDSNSNDLFDVCTQKVPITYAIGNMRNDAFSSLNKVDNPVGEDSNDGLFNAATEIIPSIAKADDVFDAPTKALPSPNNDSSKENSPTKSEAKNLDVPTTKSKFTFIKPTAKPSIVSKKKIVSFDSSIESRECGNDKANEIRPNDANVSIPDIYEMETQRLDLDNLVMNAKKISAVEAATEVDNFDAPTQIIPRTLIDILESSLHTFQRKNKTSQNKNKSKSHKQEVPLDSQESQPINTPEYSIAKQITVSKIQEYDRLWSEKQKEKLQKHKWIFQTSSDEEDDLDFDLTPAKQLEKTKLPPNNQSSKRKSLVASANDEVEMKRQRQMPKSGDAHVPAPIQLNRRRVSVVLERINVVAAKTKPLVDESKLNQYTGESGPAKAVKEMDKNFNEMKNNPIQRSLRNRNVEVLLTDHSLTKKGNTQLIETKDAKPQRTRQKKDVEGHREKEAKELKHRNKDEKMEKPVAKIDEASTSKSKIYDDLDGTANTTRINSSRSNISDTSTDSTSTRRSSRAAVLRSPSNVGQTSAPCKVMFTKIELETTSYKTIVQQLGGTIADCPRIGTVLVCERIYRTCKLLCSLCKGIPIVTPKWLLHSSKKNKFLPTDQYLLNDSQSEKRYHFSLKYSLEIARRKPLFANYTIFVTPNVKPTPQEISDIIECGGGKCAMNHQVKLEVNVKTFLISIKDDEKLWKKYQKCYPSISIVSAEGFMLSVMRQRIDLNKYILTK